MAVSHTNELQTHEKGELAGIVDRQSFVTMRVNGQLFGASVQTVQDVVREQKIACMPLSPYVIEGALNLRGRIVTVLNMRKRLRIGEFEDAKQMHVVIEYKDELFSLMVDSVGDVLNLPLNKIDKVPVNIDASWKEIAAGVCRLEEELLVLFDINELLNFDLS